MFKIYVCDRNDVIYMQLFEQLRIIYNQYEFSLRMYDWIGLQSPRSLQFCQAVA